MNKRVSLVDIETVQRVRKEALLLPSGEYWQTVNEMILAAANRGDKGVQITVPNMRTLRMFHDTGYATTEEPVNYPKPVWISW